MKDKITNAAEITILQPIDNNYKTGGGDISVGGCVVMASKGKPFKPIAIYGGSTAIEDNFGLPLPKKAAGMEGLRHVHDASEECSYVNVVRVVDPLTYRFPSLTFLLYSDRDEEWAKDKDYAEGAVVSRLDRKWICAETHHSDNSNAPGGPIEEPSTGAGGGSSGAGLPDIGQGEVELAERNYWAEFTGPAEAGAHRHDENIMVGPGAFMTIYPIDGDASVNRSLRITDVDKANRRFTIEIYDKDELGESYRLERRIVSVGEDDKDDMGMGAYIETVFERDSERFRVDYMEGVSWEAIEPILLENESNRANIIDFPFRGGTAGDEPDVSDWMLGVNVFRNERVACNLLFAAGCYDADVITALAGVADERHICFFYDVPPALKCDEAIAWDKNLGLSSRHARAYYSPYSASDQWRGGKCVWGVSGAMAAAKARCNKIVTVGSTPGVHYSPAGESRSYLTRTGLAQLFPEDRINRDSLYDARINPILGITSGGCGADDDLTHWFKTNYLRFGWINDVLDYIVHRFYEGARQVKFEPDGLTRTGLTDMTTAILEDLITSGALVAPRDPERDGEYPYRLTVEQLEIDLWKVTWEVCITGAARRIAGQPRLIR